METPGAAWPAIDRPTAPRERSRAARPSSRVDRSRRTATYALDGWSPRTLSAAREQNPAYMIDSPQPQAPDLGFCRRGVPEMSLRVSTRSVPCRVVCVSAGQSIAGFVWRFRHQPGRVFRDISLPAEHSSRRSIFVVVREFACDLTFAEILSGAAQPVPKGIGGCHCGASGAVGDLLEPGWPCAPPSGSDGVGRRSWSPWLRWRGRAPHPRRHVAGAEPGPLGVDRILDASVGAGTGMSPSPRESINAADGSAAARPRPP